VEPNSPNSVLVSALVIALVVTVLGALLGDSSIVITRIFGGGRTGHIFKGIVG
jgi:hypothetical protein